MEQPPPVLPYASADTAELPRRLWLPAIFLLLGTLVWYYQPRLRPPFFPDEIDKLALGMVLCAPVIMAIVSSLPVFYFLLYGALGALIFVSANIFYNGSVAPTNWQSPGDLFLYRSAVILGSATWCWAIAWLTRICKRRFARH